jgi:hypothetical protein
MGIVPTIPAWASVTSAGAIEQGWYRLGGGQRWHLYGDFVDRNAKHGTEARRRAQPVGAALLPRHARQGGHLAPGGQLLIQTDVASLLEEYLARLEAQPDLRNTAGRFRLAEHKPVTASSHREKRCRRDGVPIFRALLTRS